MTNFSEQLAKYRKAASISQEKLADILGISRQAVSKWETGETQPEMSNLVALCRILNVRPDQLLGWEDCDKDSDDAKPDSSKSSHFMLTIAALCVCAALIAGVFIGTVINVPEEPVSPLDGKDRVGVTSFIYDFRPDQYAELRMTFMPTIADESLTYEIVRLDTSGNTKTYEAEYKDGVCVADVETIGWDWATYNLSVRDGDGNFLSCPLFKVKDNNDYSYTHEELWEN